MTLRRDQNPAACFPDDLLTREAHDDSQGGWRVVRTRARQEKALAWDLLRCGVPYYLPLVARQQQSARRRVRHSQVPLFPGYLFLFGTPRQRYEAMATGRVVQTCHVANPTRLQRELQAVATALVSKSVEPCKWPAAGRRVRIVSGPLRGVSGVVCGYRGTRQIVLQVEAIRHALRFVVNSEEIELLLG